MSKFRLTRIQTLEYEPKKHYYHDHSTDKEMMTIDFDLLYDDPDMMMDRHDIKTILKIEWLAHAPDDWQTFKEITCGL